MRVKATEDDVYRLMDRREQYFAAVALLSIMEGVCIYLLVYQKRCWDLAYVCGALAVAVILFIRQVLRSGRRIMEAECCYLELDGDSLAVCQPEKNGHYESCRIFYEEIDKIVEGSRRGIPEFYIVLRDIEEGQESFILLDDEEQKRRIFCVRSFGFEHKKFIEFYRSLRWSVPGKVRIIGTRHQNVWNMRKAHAGICVAAGMVLGYVIPKIIEVMELF